MNNSRTKYTKKWFDQRMYLNSCYKTWNNTRLLKIILVLIGVVCYIHLKKTENLTLGLFDIIAIVVILNIVSMCQSQQSSEQDAIDQMLLGKATFHFAETFPHKGIWVHRREALLYNLRMRRFKRAIRKSVAFAQSLEERRVRRFHRLNLPFSNKRKAAKEAAAKEKTPRDD